MHITSSTGLRAALLLGLCATATAQDIDVEAMESLTRHFSGAISDLQAEGLGRNNRTGYVAPGDFYFYESDTPPVTATYRQQPVSAYHTNHFVELRAIEEEAVVTGIELNRGRCEAVRYNTGKQPAFPVFIDYGSAIRVYAQGCSRIIEATLHTNYGDFRITF